MGSSFWLFMSRVELLPLDPPLPCIRAISAISQKRTLDHDPILATLGQSYSAAPMPPACLQIRAKLTIRSNLGFRIFAKFRLCYCADTAKVSP